MGMLLLSINLNPSDNPVKTVNYLGGHNEPKNKEYVLFVDLYKLEGKFDGKIKIGVKFGGYPE